MDHYTIHPHAPTVSAALPGFLGQTGTDQAANSTYYELIQPVAGIQRSFTARALIILAVVALPVISILVRDTIGMLRDRSQKLNYLTTLNLKDGDYSKASRDWQSNYAYYMKLGYEKVSCSVRAANPPKA